MNFWNLLFLGKQNFYHKTHWYEALFAKVVGAGKKLIAKFLKIKGNTLVWNQLVQNGNFANGVADWSANGTKSASDGVATWVPNVSSANFYKSNFPVTQGHYYLCFATVKLTTATNGVYIRFSGQSIGQCKSTTDWQTLSAILQRTGATGTTSYGIINVPNDSNSIQIKNMMLIDLTKMFESGNEPTTVEEFTSLYPLPYYQYTEGKLLPFGTPQQVTWNQLVDAPQTSGDYDVQGVNLTYGTNTITLNSGTASSNIKVRYNNYDLTSGHKYAVWGSPKKSNVNNYYLYIADSTGNTSRKAIFAEPVIYDCQVTENARLYVHVEKGITANHNVFQPQIVDLTVMYGSGNEPSIEYFKQNYSGYYPYDSGSTVSANVSGLKTVGFNQWDEEWANEHYDISTTTGELILVSTSLFYLRSKNYIPVLPNTVYYNYNGMITTNYRFFFYDANKNYLSFISQPPNETLTTPNNAYYMLFRMVSESGVTYNHNICINISSDKNGTYESYKSSTTSIPTLTYFPTGMKSAGNAFDELTNSKAITRVWEYTFTGNESWTASATPNRFSTTISNYLSSPIASQPTSTNAKQNVVSSKYGQFVFVNQDKVAYTYTTGSGTTLVINDSSLSTKADVKTATTGTTIQYELAEEQVVDIDPPLKLNYQVWEGGTEQLLPINTENPVTSPILADIKYPDGERDDQYFTYRQYLPNSRMMSMALNTIMGKSVEFNQQALDILMKGE